MIRRAVQAGHPVRSVLCAERWVEPLADLLEPLEAPVYVADDDVLREITGFDVHRGALAAMGRLPLPSIARPGGVHPPAARAGGRRGPDQCGCGDPLCRGTGFRGDRAGSPLRRPAVPPRGQGVDGRRLHRSPRPRDEVAGRPGGPEGPWLRPVGPDPGGGCRRPGAARHEPTRAGRPAGRHRGPRPVRARPRGGGRAGADPHAGRGRLAQRRRGRGGRLLRPAPAHRRRRVETHPHEHRSPLPAARRASPRGDARQPSRPVPRRGHGGGAHRPRGGPAPRPRRSGPLSSPAQATTAGRCTTTSPRSPREARRWRSP